jgi:hypothetical protein
MKQCPVFPVHALPEELQRLCAEVSAFDSVQAGIAAMAALTIMSGAIGPSAVVRRVTTQEVFTGQSFLLIRSDAGHAPWFPGLLGPVRELQNRMLAVASLESDEIALCAKESRIRRLREQFLRNDRFPEESHSEYFDDQLRRIKLQRRRWFYLESPQPGALLGAFARSSDQFLLLAWPNSHSFVENCSFWETAQGKGERDLMLRALRGEMLVQPIESGGLIPERPSLSGIAVSTREGLKEFIASDSPLLLGTAPFFTRWRHSGREAQITIQPSTGARVVAESADWAFEGPI